MGQCVSTKAAAVGAHNSRPMSRPLVRASKISDEVKENRRSAQYTRGVATSFGFRKRPETAIPVYSGSVDNSRKKLSPDSVDDNGNDDSLESFETSNNTSLPGTRLPAPRLPAPKKLPEPSTQPATTRVSRFGFRQTSLARPQTASARLPESAASSASVNAHSQPATNNKFKNNNIEKPRAKGGGKTVTIAPTVPKHKNNFTTGDNNKNKNMRTNVSTNLPTKYTLHSSQLPKPQLPVRVMETKTAKTAANINRKVSGSSCARSDEGGSSIEGSITGDSGVGSQTSGQSNGNPDSDTLHGVDVMDCAQHPPFRRPSSSSMATQRPRHLEMMISGNNFDVRDLDDCAEDEVVTEVAVIPLPRLPSVFANNISTGVVRERTREYQRQLDKINIAHSFSDDYGEEEKSFRDLSSNEKSRATHGSLSLGRYSPVNFRSFSSNKEQESSPPSSDEQEWAQAGEAMLDSNMYQFSSSDESREPGDRSSPPLTASQRAAETSRVSNVISPVMDCSFTSTSGSASSSYTGAIPKNPPKSVLLTIEDPFAAVAAKSTGTLLDDETSPQDSLISSFTESEDIVGNSVKKAKSNASGSGSKDLNEKSPLSPTSPGTPTNTSLSLSEGRDFLIDDEIADQPALMFDETCPLGAAAANLNTTCDEVPHSEQVTDSIATLVDTPKKTRRYHANSIAASIDTLSPCESIASDDMMLDFEHSQSSGIDDSTDRLNESSGLHSLDDVTLRYELGMQHDSLTREWSSFLGNKSYSSERRGTAGSGVGLLRSRTNTPSSVPESPRLLSRARAPSALQHSPLVTQRARTTHSTPHNYDSDDATQQDLIEIKSLVLKLQNVLQETDGDLLTRKEPLNSFDNQAVLRNGIYVGLKETRDSSLESMDCCVHGSGHSNGCCSEENSSEQELAELRKHVLFLQSQLEDRDRTVQQLQGRVAKYSLSAQLANANQQQPPETCNAATQTDRVRPLSAGPSLLQSLPSDGSMGPLVSFRIGKRE